MISTVRTLGWVLYTLSFASCARAQQPADTPPTILAAKGDSVHVRLFDAATVRPIASTEMELYSDNGIRCIKAPCPTDGKSWKGNTDANGRLAIPKSALNATANLKSATYIGDLVADATPDASGDWTVELFPEERGDPGPHPLKLIGARTHWVVAPGYKDAHIDFAWTRRKMYLVPR